MDLVLLSHIIRPDGPVYPGDPPPALDKRADVRAGDGYTAWVMHLSNHCGTHVDGPRHFNPDAPTLDQLALDRFVFYCPLLVDVPCGDDYVIGADELRRAVPKGLRPDLLMIRTGFEELRRSDPERYAAHSPGLSAAAAQWLATLPGLAAVALDTISAGAPAHPDEAFAVHRILCGVGRRDRWFALIYEDVSLSTLATSPVRVLGLPLVVAGVDSAPATVIAEV